MDDFSGVTDDCVKCGRTLEVASERCEGCGLAVNFSELAGSAKERSIATWEGGFRATCSTRNSWVWLQVPGIAVWIGFLVSLWAKSTGPNLFSIFALIGLLVSAGYLVMGVCGRVEVSRQGDEGRIFQGVGRHGWTRRFLWKDVRSIGEGRSDFRNHYRPIEMELQQGWIRFGSLLSQQSRWFLVQLMRSQI